MGGTNAFLIKYTDRICRPKYRLSAFSSCDQHPNEEMIISTAKVSGHRYPRVTTRLTSNSLELLIRGNSNF